MEMLRCHARLQVLYDVTGDASLKHRHESVMNQLCDEMDLFCGVCNDVMGSTPEKVEPLQCGHFIHGRKGLWQIMERLGCPPKFLSMVIQLHKDQRGQVRHSNDLSKPFPVSNGVKQGCVLAPTLFTIFFSMMLQRATKDLDDEDGIYIRYRTDGSLFNLTRLQAHTKTLEQLIRELLF